jgi:hypothetical protein
MFDIRHNWTEEDVTRAELRRLNGKEPITMTGFYSICASLGILVLFTGKNKIELNKVKNHPSNEYREKALQRQVTVEKIKKKKQTFNSGGFLRGPSKKIKGVSKKKMLSLLRKGSKG